ncbi:transmembrane protein 265-like isoform 1-T3 [Clarias gariepinus]|uniref:transmembrane protein 265-like n=1 Tax=Clarias gariepinus TaxID=13013 RepID=UPI00234CB30A|nr:transmembrane protein 265-like [Clarias gariepinus]XP_053370820.1 transmembrane protein 265-like [Clarias gariepinus]XP_053370821.1 transmembrane protein 265-like [Clarias gariepinus]
MSTSNHTPVSSTPLDHTDNVERGYDGVHHRARDYRKLAICSIVCGLSCVGIMSLIYSVKTRELNKRSRSEKAEEYSRKTLYWAIGSFFALLVFIALIVLLLGLLSYILTFIN